MKTKQYIGKPVEFPHFPHGRWKPNKLSRFDSTEKAQEVPKNILIKDLKKKIRAYRNSPIKIHENTYSPFNTSR